MDRQTQHGCYKVIKLMVRKLKLYNIIYSIHNKMILRHQPYILWATRLQFFLLRLKAKIFKILTLRKICILIQFGQKSD